MLITSWYYDERDQMFKKTSLEELKRMEYENKEEFLYIKIGYTESRIKIFLWY